MSREEQIQRLSDELVKKLADEGRVVEGGWAAMRLLTVPPDAPAIQVNEMRKAFFMGAQHLYASIMEIMDKDREPTERDFKRMELIHNELEAFRKEVTSFHSGVRV